MLVLRLGYVRLIDPLKRIIETGSRRGVAWQEHPTRSVIVVWPL